MTYTYKCPKCGYIEKDQRITEDALTECETCGSEIGRVIVGEKTILFKGKGFYCTDNKKF